MQLLAESGADVNTALLTVAHLGHSIAVDLLIQAGAVVNKRNLSGNTPLILAAQRSDAKSLSVLIKAGADVNYRNSDWECNEYSTLEKKRLKITQRAIFWLKNCNVSVFF